MFIIERVFGQEDIQRKKHFQLSLCFDSGIFRARRQYKEKNNFLAVRVFRVLGQEDNTKKNDFLAVRVFGQEEKKR